MTDLEKYLREVERRAETATEGPWTVYGEDDMQGWPFITVECDGVAKICEVQPTSDDNGSFQLCDRDHATAEFIAASRTDIPRLTAMLRVALEALEISCNCTYRQVAKNDWVITMRVDVECSVCTALARIDEIAKGEK